MDRKKLCGEPVYLSFTRRRVGGLTAGNQPIRKQCERLGRDFARSGPYVFLSWVESLKATTTSRGEQTGTAESQPILPLFVPTLFSVLTAERP